MNCAHSSAVTRNRCEAGYSGTITSSASRCFVCAVGKYSDDLGPDCEACPDDSTTNGTASEVVTDCLCALGHTGTISNPNSNCTACEAGQYKDVVGDADCVACPAASGTNGTGGTAADECLCDPGHFGSIEGPTDSCNLCPAGTYSEAAGAANCTGCPRNSTTLADGSSAVSNCLCDPGAPSPPPHLLLVPRRSPPSLLAEVAGS